MYTQFHAHRHPLTTERPGFRPILLSLLAKEDVVLAIPSDMISNNLAVLLGAPLEAGIDMYPELQTMYCDDK